MERGARRGRGECWGAARRMAVLVALAQPLCAAEYHVATDGADTGAGSAAAPFRSIQRAADVMQPGDTCLIRSGVYREWVKPPRGGTGEGRRITYRAAPGAEVLVKGSERVRTWTRAGGGLWRLEVSDGFFGGRNPFKRHLAGEWLFFGFEHHLGEIFLDGEALAERLRKEDLDSVVLSWWGEPTEGRTVLWANFGPADPNERETEIAVRPCIFFPEQTGLGYITVEGLDFAHAASQWAYWNAPQEAALGTGFGHHWTIENCRFRDVRCVALVCGNTAARPGDGFDVAAVGRHVVRRNSFARCGEAAIHGNRGWAGSLIEGNLIEDINGRNEFGGMETGGMKIHYAVDTTIRGNVIRRVHGRQPPVYSHPKGWGPQFVGLWVDWGAQGTRVTGNVVTDVEGWATFIQNNHGSPILIDHNVFAGLVSLNSQGVVFAQNLFVNSPWLIRKGAVDAPYWEPHSGRRAGIAPIPMAHVKWWNNVFVGQGAEKFPGETAYESDGNLFIGGARPTLWGDVHSQVMTSVPEIRFTHRLDGVEVEVTMELPSGPSRAVPVTAERVGTFALTGQRLDQADGTPMTLERDIRGARRTGETVAAGPLAEWSAGRNSFVVTAGARREVRRR